MTSDKKDQNEEFGAHLQGEGHESVDDFIKQLEAAEKDLHISSEMVIEVEDADFDDLNIPEFILHELQTKAEQPQPQVIVVPPVPTKPDARVGDLQNEVDALKQKIAALIAERTEVLARTSKQVTELENFKSRMERERVDTFNRQLENLAIKMLPVLDNLNRAIEFTSQMAEEKRQEFETFFEGIILVDHQMHDIFAGMGVCPINAVGSEFDPHFHEAAALVEDGTVSANTVVEELLRGYMIGKRVIRHTMVKVSKAPKAPSILTTEPGPEEPLNENGQIAG